MPFCYWRAESLSLLSPSDILKNQPAMSRVPAGAPRSSIQTPSSCLAHYSLLTDFSSTFVCLHGNKQTNLLKIGKSGHAILPSKYSNYSPPSFRKRAKVLKTAYKVQ